MRFARILLLSVLTCLFLTVPGCKTAGTNTGQNGPIRIGFSMDSLQLEPWQRGRDLFVQKAKGIAAVELVQCPDGNDSLHVQQAENLLTQGVDVPVIVPRNGGIAASLVVPASP